VTVIKNTELENATEQLRREIRSMAARQDVDALAQVPREQLEIQRGQAAERVENRSARSLDENRSPTDREDTLSKADLAEIEAIDAALVLNERNERQRQTIVEGMELANRSRSIPTEGRGHPPLLVSQTHLRSHAEAIRAGSTFGAEEDLVESRAAVTVATDFGSPGAWGDGGIAQPIPLRQFANIPASKLTGATAQMPSLTLPVAAAGVAEGTVHGEYDTINVANLTTLRYGRWTQVTSFVDEFDQLRSINQAHAVGIARDLNLVDITAIQTAAGSVVAFDSPNLDRNVRQAILKVAAAAVVAPENVVLFGGSAAMGVVTGYAPASGDDRGSVTTRVFGARAYVDESAVAGNVYAFAPQGFIVFQTGLRSATTLDPTNGSPKFGSWLHSTAAGLFIVGAAAGVDVVTP
jgi:hypothetical protein